MENNTKKWNAGLIVLIIIFLLALIGTSIWILFFNGGTLNIFGNKQTGENEKEGTKIVSTLEVNQHVVPQIEIKNSENIVKVNKDIMDYYGSPIHSNMDKFEYNYYINGDILSLVITANSAVVSNMKQYKVYNVDVNTGNTVSSQSIMEKIGMGQRDYSKLLKAALNRKFDEMFGDIPHDKVYNEMLEKTIDPDNCLVNNTEFLNADGVLCRVCKIYSVAGSGTYDRIVKIEPKSDLQNISNYQCLNTSLGNFIIYSGEVYYEGSNKALDLSGVGVYGTYTYPEKYATTSQAAKNFAGYKLNITNVASAYEVSFGNGGIGHYVEFITADGKLSELSMVEKSKNNFEVKLTKNIPGINDVASVLKSSSVNANYAILVHKDGTMSKYSGASNSNAKPEKSVYQSISVDEAQVIVNEGNVYLRLLNDNATSFKSALAKVGTYGQYTYPNGYISSSVTEKFYGYKLNLTGVKAAYEVPFGNGSSSKSVMFITNDGKVINMTISKDAGGNVKVELINNVGGYKDIVSIARTGSMSGWSVILIDKNGNTFEYFGV